MLASEEHHMKTHKNQQLLTMPSPLGPLLEPCARGQTSVPEGQKPLERPCMRRLVREVCSQSVDCKALSWGIIRKSACILTKITIRRSQVSWSGGSPAPKVSKRSWTSGSVALGVACAHKRLPMLMKYSPTRTILSSI